MYNFEQMDALFNPKSIAIIGASTNEIKFGYQTLEMLVGENFKGSIYPINPKADKILGIQCYKSLSALPETPDIAALLIPAQYTLDIVKECVSMKIKGVVIVTSGFSEAGEEGKNLQLALEDCIAMTSTHIIGPNCQGIINVQKAMVLSFSQMFKRITPGPISVISHSGSYCGILARRLSKSGVGIAKIVSSGNEVDLSAVDYLKYYAGDPDTKVILAYLEELRRPEELKKVLSSITRKKPIVMQKAGRTSVGATAVSSHTGALAGSNKVVTAFLKQNGVVQVKSINDLVNAGLGLATQPLAAGNRIAIISGVGGLAVETAELCVENGLSIPKLSSDTQAKLKSALPYFAAVTNPIDMTGVAYGDPKMVGETLKVILEDENIDAVLFILTIAKSVEFAKIVNETIKRYNKPALMCWTAGVDITPGPINYLKENGVPIFDSPEQLVTAISAIIQYSRYRLGEKFIFEKEN